MQDNGTAEKSRDITIEDIQIANENGFDCPINDGYIRLQRKEKQNVRNDD